MCMLVISQLQFQFESWICFNCIMIKHLHSKWMQIQTLQWFGGLHSWYDLHEMDHRPKHWS
jgi:hypothetical protein